MLTWVCTPQGASGNAANALKEHFGYYLVKKYSFFFKFQILVAVRKPKMSVSDG